MPPVYKPLVRIPISEAFKTEGNGKNSAEDNLRDTLKGKRYWHILAELIGCDVDDIKSVKKKIPFSGNKEGDLLVTMVNDDIIYVELQLGKFDSSHTSRCKYYVQKSSAVMGVLVAEDVDVGWEQEMIDDYMAEKRFHMTMRTIQFYSKEYTTTKICGDGYNKYFSNTSSGRKPTSGDIEQIGDLFNRGYTTISRKYKEKHYPAEIISETEIKYKNNIYTSYTSFYKGVTPDKKTNPHWTGESIYVKIDGEWQKLLDL